MVTGTMEFYDFPFSWECHDPNWRTPSFFRGVGLNHQPDSYIYIYIYIYMYYTTNIIYIYMYIYIYIYIINNAYHNHPIIYSVSLLSYSDPAFSSERPYQVGHLPELAESGRRPEGERRAWLCLAVQLQNHSSNINIKNPLGISILIFSEI